MKVKPKRRKARVAWVKWHVNGTPCSTGGSVEMAHGRSFYCLHEDHDPVVTRVREVKPRARRKK